MRCIYSDLTVGPDEGLLKKEIHQILIIEINVSLLRFFLSLDAQFFHSAIQCCAADLQHFR
jgi:hypothetical protein